VAFTALLLALVYARITAARYGVRVGAIALKDIILPETFGTS
jgi:hypothetical protein